MYLEYVDVRPMSARGYSAPAPVFSTVAVPGMCALGCGNEAACPPPNVRYDWNYNAEGWPSNSVDGSAHMVPCYVAHANTTARQDGHVARAVAVTRATYASPLVTTLVALPAGDYAGYGGTDSGVKQVASTHGSSFWIAGIAGARYGYRYLAAGAGESALVCGMGTLESRGSAFIEPGTASARGIAIGVDGQLYGASDFHLEHTFGGLYGIGSGAPSALTHAVSRIWGISNTDPAAATVAYQPYTFVIETTTSIWVSQDVGTIVHYTQAPGSTAVIRHGKWLVESKVVISGEVAPLFSLAGRFEAAEGAFVVYAASPSAAYRLVPSSGAAPAVVATAACGECFHGVAFPPLQPGAPACPTPPPSATPTPCPCPSMLPY